MKIREQRRHVMINSRMRSGASWVDARILNISSRGLGLQSAAPPNRGAYVEFRRGRHIIIAQAMWVKGLRFGVRTQDAVPIDAIVEEAKPADACSANDMSSAQFVERRATARHYAQRHDHSRGVGRAVEFVFAGILGASAAMAAFNMIGQALGAPLAQVQSALASK